MRPSGSYIEASLMPFQYQSAEKNALDCILVLQLVSDWPLMQAARLQARQWQQPVRAGDWSRFGAVQSIVLQRGKAMVHASFNLRKVLLATTASVLALAATTPATAQETTTTDDTQKPKVTPDQIQGPVGPAQVRAGANAQPGDIVITGIRASIQASLNSKRNND